MILKMNPLIVITQPRDIPEFIKRFYAPSVGPGAADHYDRLILKYTRPGIAWHKARELFLQHREYTHYVYGTDDLLFDALDLDRMLTDYERMMIPDKEVLVADMNLDQERSNIRGWQLDKYPIPPLLPGRGLLLSDYHFADLDNPETEITRAIEDGGFIKVSWSAMALAVIPRNIMEAVSFDNTVQYCHDTSIPEDLGYSVDVVFSQECKDKGFSMWINLNVQTIHLKPSVRQNLWHEEFSYVDKRPKEWFILKADSSGKRIDIIS